MIPAQTLIDKFKIPLSEGWGYIWGAVGQVWTEAKQRAATREMTVKHGAKWIGKRVIDCSGMFYWAYKELGYSIYHGSNTIWKSYCSSKGQLKDGTRSDGQPIKPGTAVFLYRASDQCRHHIGLYIGDNTVIEAKGTINGVVTSKLSHWDEWGELKDVDYSGEEGDKYMPTLRRGSTGPDVELLQQALNNCGFGPMTVDGKFGSGTQAAVKAFQSANGLTADGICGPLTWAALLDEDDPEPVPVPDDPDEDSDDDDQDVPSDREERIEAAIGYLKKALELLS